MKVNKKDLFFRRMKFIKFAPSQTNDATPISGLHMRNSLVQATKNQTQQLSISEIVVCTILALRGFQKF